MSPDSSRSIQFPGTTARMHCDGLADDEAIVDELADGLTGVCVGDFGDFVGVEPDLVFAAADD